jgi:hypothetical protein
MVTGPTLYAEAERELPLSGDGVYFDGSSLSVKKGGLVTVNRTRAVSGIPGSKEYDKDSGPIPDGTYRISPQIKRSTVTEPQPGICGVAGIGSGYQEVTCTEEAPCAKTDHTCTIDCSDIYEPGTFCRSPQSCWGAKRIAIEGSVEVTSPKGGKATRGGFYIHGGNHEVTVTSGCIKIFDDSVFDRLREFTSSIPLVVNKGAKAGS